MRKDMGWHIRFLHCKRHCNSQFTYCHQMFLHGYIWKENYSEMDTNNGEVEECTNQGNQLYFISFYE